jgi:hypothetical protein
MFIKRSTYALRDCSSRNRKGFLGIKPQKTKQVILSKAGISYSALCYAGLKPQLDYVRSSTVMIKQELQFRSGN